jgi:HK97 family phage portal protein
MYPGADVGYAPVEAARQSIGSGMAAQEYAARFLDQDSTPGGVIEVPSDMPPEKTSEMARSWARKHAGKQKTGLPGVLVGGATWKQTAVTNEQAQFLESRGFTAAEIAAQMFLIDPADLGIAVQGTSLTYANISERNLRCVQVTFLPWIVRLERALTSLMPAGQYVKFNLGGLLRGDMKTRFETYKIGKEIDVLLDDEIRGWEELPPLPVRAVAPPTLVAQIEAVGQLIRAGFEPAAALEFLGLPPIEHTGLVPITVTQESA